MKNIKVIYLAGGCFWGTEAYFKKLKGIVKTLVGYANGDSDETNYEIVSRTDHAETVKIYYDFSKISLTEILLHYFRIINPKSINRQGNDIGRQYRTGIYWEERDINSEKIVKDFIEYEEEKIGKVAVEVSPIKNFVKAEEYHQDYLDKNPNGYCHINLNSAEDPIIDDDRKFVEKNKREFLDDISYDVMERAGTERPFTSELNKEYRRGIYVDKLSKKPLFSSRDKFDAGCGWPSFSRPIVSNYLEERKDTSLGMLRTEVKSKSSDSHLGHVFEDGPVDRGGLRYCINGAALEFIPYEEMDDRGYCEYKIFVK
ncbi:peptide-methionine (R)-S-oxide reductase MsrB [Peptoniphilus sp. AGMB00490]|uniref:Peptide methionine sulfoxide reductase MsrA n=1 Tax=Peptoniphilus faecalis TaxID=2731255 RepID=A0A848RIR1_9FIRM|nr:peptide-methionine (R)-S-oxide reductase MsrB [Peptoniphilus faecalis]NMW85701.1 peptide-methionine (R)-S-oxide reductase MsrB [Peptoniphilus faecalis]